MLLFKSKTKILSEAIADKKIVRFNYCGHPRIVEPHLIGKKKGGLNRKILCAWFLDGYSKSGFKNPNIRWKMYPISRISQIEFTGEYFHGPRNLGTHQQCIVEKIICRVESKE